jgi:deazaflavin-dependent oxidoreductase (nitroreductase family)
VSLGADVKRPWLGLRRAPGRLALVVFRLPLWLYRRGWGWMLGRTFVMFVHVGRRTGDGHEAVAMVLDDNKSNGEVVICSAWGPDADWLRNLHAGPAREVHIAGDCFVPDHRLLGEDEAFTVATSFRRRHPRRLQLISTVLGWGDLGDDEAVRGFVHTHPFVAFRPATVRG